MNYRKTRAGSTNGGYYIVGVGAQRNVTYGLVEKVYGGWFATTVNGDERSCDKLADGAQWVADQYKPKIITLQPSALTDHITDDGVELTQLPYPFHVDADGLVGRQDFWKGDPYRVIGFVADLARQEVDLWWEAVADGDEQRAVGMYLITQNQLGDMATHLTAIESVTVGVVKR